jgi:NTE family protein
MKDFANIIKTCQLFTSITFDEQMLSNILAEVIEISLDQDQVLFENGDASDGFYILIEGKLIAYLRDENTLKIQVVGQINEGEIVGELGALSGKPRSLGVRTVEKSFLLKFSTGLFKKLCQRYPSLLTAAFDPIVARSQQVIQLISAKNIKKHIVIIPANGDVSFHQFEKTLSSLSLDSTDFCLINEENIETTNASSKTHLEKLIGEAEEKNQQIIYLLKSEETLLSKLCWNDTEKIYVLAAGNSTARLSDFVEKKIKSFAMNLIAVKLELILLYSAGEEPQNTLSWLALANFHLHHHIRETNTQDFSRLMRFFKGNAIGLVLSGGGAKGLAHIGALKALMEAGIPIDAFGGTSIGAAVAALINIYENYDVIQQHVELFVEEIERTATFRNLVWPKASIFNCRRPTQQIKKSYGEQKIENLWLPFFAVSCNINRYTEEVHRQGLLWEAVRASVSVPGLIPPMVIKGELYVDGGLINNLPVNIMRDLLGATGRIIAVDLSSGVIDETVYHFSPEHSFQEAIFAFLGLGYKSNKYPNLLDLFFKSLLIGSSIKQIENSKNADLLIQPETAGIHMLKTKNAGEKTRLLMSGYNATQEKISAWKKTESFR